MGLFDILILGDSIKCPDCGIEINSVQTKVFENCLDTYEPGDITRGCSIRTGLISETLYCEKCRWPKGRDNGLVYIAIWHSIYIGIFISEDEAEERLRSIDRLDLIEWLDKAQTERELWHRRFNNVYQEISILSEYEKAEDKEAFLSNTINLLSKSELLEAEDPLDDLVKRHKFKARDVNGGIFGD
jgi:hypothetical protein